MRIGKMEDQATLERIRDRIRWDKRISEADVKVMISHGRVTLFGVVDCAQKKIAAIELAASTLGVEAVENQILVTNGKFREDGDIKEILVNQINSMGLMPGEYIFVDVISGIVKLEGSVFRSFAKGRAVGAAWELSGVKDCLNLIEIKDPARSSAKTFLSVLATGDRVERST